MSDLLERLKAALADRYAVESEIDRGGMATVFLADDLKHHRKVAIKVLHPELTVTLAADRFLQEIQIAAGLNHPHILALFDSGEADGLLYYIMPYVAGESLRQRLERESQLAVEEAVRIAVEVADGLGFAHRQGVIHRDIKPGNILLSDKHAVITDFGIARAITVAQGERVTSTGLGVGTPLYASPEQATGAETLDGRTDIYSLGCVIYEMLAGEVPLAASTPQAVQARRLAETPSPIHPMRDTVPPLLDQVIGKALARLPADRWDTAEHFGNALMTATMDATPVARLDLALTPGLVTATRRPARRLLKWLLIAAPLVAAAAVGVWLVNDRLATEEPAQSGAPTAAVREVQLTQGVRAFLPSISPDGGQFAFGIVEEDGGIRIVVRDTEDTQPEKTLAVVDALRSLDWLPDGSALVLSGSHLGQSGYYTVPTTGGRLQPVAGRVFSPDGSEVLQWERDWKHVLVLSTEPARADTAGRAERLDSIPIAGDYWTISDIAYSPRGDYLAVATGRGMGDAEIRAVSRDGEDQHILAPVIPLPYSLNWRADGRVLYYVRFLYGGTVLMRIATTPSGEAVGEPELLFDVGRRDVDITPDGRRLVVQNVSTGVRIVRLRRAGPDSLHVEPIPGTDDAREFFWVSPNGRWLAFIREGTLGLDIYKVPIEGGRPQRLTSVGTIWDFRWSPDSEILAFSARWQDTMTVWFVPASGGSPTPLAGSRSHGDLSWAPGPLMYRKTNGSFWVADSLHIRIGDELLPLTAANLNRSGGVVEEQGRPFVTNDSLGRVQGLAVSPDGRWVFTWWERQDNPGQWKISLTDSTQTLVQPDARSRIYWPETQTPDGRAVIWQSENEFVLIPTEGDELETVLTLPEEPEYRCDPVYTDSELSFVCWEILGQSSDVWLIENFDPHLD
jgi:serine/threonine-protein kinase